MDLSIIIVNWNTRDLLKKSLQAAFATLPDIPFEIIVVDNASTDGSAEMVRRDFPRAVLMINPENAGFARANNQAIRASRGENILLLNSDAFLTEGAAACLLQALAGDSRLGIVGANLFFPDGRPQDSHGPLPSLGSEALSLAGLDKLLNRRRRVARDHHAVETGTVSGACLMVRRRVLDQVGLLDERYFFSSEEVDLCCRAHQAGWKVVHLPAARVIHVGGGSTGTTARRILMLYRGKRQYFARHFGPQAERKLLFLMKSFTRLKVIVYSILHVWKPGQYQQDRLWRMVAEGLKE